MRDKNCINNKRESLPNLMPVMAMLPFFCLAIAGCSRDNDSESLLNSKTRQDVEESQGGITVTIDTNWEQGGDTIYL